MCGIVSIISRTKRGFFHGDLEIFQNLLMFDAIRGEDSTGAFAVMRDKQVTINKIGSHPMHFFSTAGWGKFKNRAIQNARIVVGHNRKATLGAVNSDNAHPFHENNIILVHNGTLRGGHKQLANTEVDSHAVCHAFNEKGAENVIPTIDGAFAFVWWDMAKNRLCAIRNDERPLTLVTTEEHYFVCSEAWMPVVLNGRASKKIISSEDFDPGILHEFDMAGNIVKKEIALKKATAVVEWPEYGHWSHRQGPHQSSYNSRHIRSAYDDMEDDEVWSNDKDAKEYGGAASSPTKTPFEACADKMITNQTPFVTNPEYGKGEEVLIKIYTSVKAQDAMDKITGKIIEPGKTMLDFVGFIPSAGVYDKTVPQLMDGECVADIKSFSTSNCGPSAWVGNIRPTVEIKVHNTNLSEKIWKYLVKDVKCKDCGNEIHSCEAEFTSVIRHKNNQYRVTCADCIEHKLPKEMQDAFIESRLTAIQDGISKREKSTSTALTIVGSKNPPSVH